MSPSPSPSGHASDAPPLALQPGAGRMRTQSSATLPPTRFDSYPPPIHAQQQQQRPPPQQQQQQGISGVQHGGGADGAPHDVNDCPGCRADFEAALAASRSSAAAENARRTQDLSEEERAQIAAIELSAAEERSRQQAEEDELLRQVMAASLRDEQEANKRRLERQRNDESQRLAAAESSRREAAEAQARREEEQRRLDAIEHSVLEESRREMEREWIRRDEEERATQEFVSRGGTVGEAAYWQHLHHDGAYALAVRMNEQASSGTSEARRPLPQPPAAEAVSSPVAPLASPRPVAQDGTASAGVHQAVTPEEEEEEDPFADSAEAPPMYDDARRDPPPEISHEAPPLPLPPAPAALPLPSAAAAAPAPPRNGLPSGVALSLATNNGSDLLRNESGRTVTPLTLGQHARLDVPALVSPGPSSPAIEIGSFDEAIRVPGEPDIAGNPLLSVLSDPRRLSSSSSRLSPTPEAELMTATEAHHSMNKPLPSSPSSELPNGLASALGRTNRQPSVDSASVQSHGAAAHPELERQDSTMSLASGFSVASGAPSTSATSMEPGGGEESRSRRSSSQQARDFSQTTMPGTDFGYACEPFAPELFVSPKSANVVDGKLRFPNVIQLTRPADDASGITRGTDKSSFFTIRAPSWKGLLRAMAWYGNTTITAGPQEVADAALAAEAPGARPGAELLHLSVEVEFVTPSRLPDGALNSMMGAGSSGRAAHVSLCISLFTKARAQRTPLAKVLRDTSRSLDASYLRRGSARRVIALPKAAPSLPLGMVVLAQHVHAAHRFSAACPTTSSKALHSPRDLHHAIEAHDTHYIGKLALAANAAGSAAGKSSSQVSINVSAEAGEVTAFDDDAEEGLGTVGRLAARVKRRLKKRGGDGAVVDESLQSWITPFTDDAPVDDAWEEPGRASFETRGSQEQSR